MAKTLLVLAGPTAVGKTSCGIELARRFDTEIISADSRQIYKETFIGTAVPSPAELAAVKHHFIQVSSLADPYNASRFEMEVMDLLSSLFQKHDMVLMVGGSGLYIDAVCQGIDDLPSVNSEIRDRVLIEFREKGLARLQDRLKILDPKSYERIDLNNHMRVMKALEISMQTGLPYSSFLTQTSKERPFRILRMALDMKRELLYERINMRVEHMMEAGLLEEVKSVLPFRGVTPLKTVGYKEIFSFLDGESSLDEAVDHIKRNTRKFARKQLTWFRKNQLYRWFSPDQEEEMTRWIMEA